MLDNYTKHSSSNFNVKVRVCGEEINLAWVFSAPAFFMTVIKRLMASPIETLTASWVPFSCIPDLLHFLWTCLPRCLNDCRFYSASPRFFVSFKRFFLPSLPVSLTATTSKREKSIFKNRSSLKAAHLIETYCSRWDEIITPLWISPNKMFRHMTSSLRRRLKGRSKKREKKKERRRRKIR